MKPEHLLWAILAGVAFAPPSLAVDGISNTLNRFSVEECNRILASGDEATKTLRAILAATKTPSCADVKVDARGRARLTALRLRGLGLTDLSPFRLFTIGGSLDLARNEISLPPADRERQKVADPAVTLVYGDSDDGVRQERLIATSTLQHGKGWSLGRLHYVGRVTACVAEGGVLRPRMPLPGLPGESIANL